MGVKYSAVRVTGMNGESVTWTYPSLAEAQAAHFNYAGMAGVKTAELLTEDSVPRLVDPDALVSIVRLAADYLQDFAAAIERLPQPAKPEPATAYDRGSPTRYIVPAMVADAFKVARDAHAQRNLSCTEQTFIRDGDGDMWQRHDNGTYSLFNSEGVREIGPWTKDQVEQTYGVYRG